MEHLLHVPHFMNTILFNFQSNSGVGKRGPSLVKSEADNIGGGSLYEKE